MEKATFDAEMLKRDQRELNIVKNAQITIMELIVERDAYLTALEQIWALQPTEPDCRNYFDAPYHHGLAHGHYEAARIADAAIRGQGKGRGKEGNTNG